MGRVKYSFFPQKVNQRSNILRRSNYKAQRKGKPYLLTSYNVNDVTECAPHEDNGNVTLMTQGAKQDFILHFATLLMLQSCFPANNEVQTMFSPILIPDKTLVDSEIMFNFSCCFGLFYVPTKNLRKEGEKQSIISLSM